MSLLILQSISKRFDSTAVVTVHLSRRTSEAARFFGLLGPSGCGKTSNSPHDCRTGKTDTWQIEFDQRAISLYLSLRGSRLRHEIFQTYAHLPTHLTVFENVAFGLPLPANKLSEIVRAVSSVVWELVQLPELFEKRKVDELSGRPATACWHPPRNCLRAGLAAFR